MPVIALTLHANFTPFIDQLDNTFFLTLFPLHQDSHEYHEIPEDHMFHSDIQQKHLQLILVLVVYKSTSMPIQPLVCPVIHYGTPTSRSLSNTVRDLSTPTAGLIRTPLMGIPVSTTSAGTLQGNDVGMTVYWRTTTRVVEPFAKTTSPIQSTHRYRWGTRLRDRDCFLVLIWGLTDRRTIGLPPCWSSRLADVVRIQRGRSMSRMQVLLTKISQTCQSV